LSQLLLLNDVDAGDGERRREEEIMAYYGRPKPEIEINPTTTKEEKGPQE